MSANRSEHRHLRAWSLVGALLVIVALLALPSAASAQQPPICQQYPDLPICDEGGGGGDDDDDGDGFGPAGAGGPSAGIGTGGGGDGGGGELPFTGYPLSLLVLLLLLLLAIGLTIRLYLAARDRWHARHASTGPPLDFS